MKQLNETDRTKVINCLRACKRAGFVSRHGWDFDGWKTAKRNSLDVWKIVTNRTYAYNLCKRDAEIFYNVEGFMPHFFLPMLEVLTETKSYSKAMKEFENYLRMGEQSRRIVCCLPLTYFPSQKFRRRLLSRTPPTVLQHSTRKIYYKVFKKHQNYRGGQIFGACLLSNLAVKPNQESISQLFDDVNNLHSKLGTCLELVRSDPGDYFEYWYPIMDSHPFGIFSEHQFAGAQDFVYHEPPIIFTCSRLLDERQLFNTFTDRSITDDQIKRIGRLFAHSTLKNKSVALACSFLVLGGKQKSLSLRFLCYFIGLEAIFSPNDTFESTYRIKLRVAKLLGRTQDEMREHQEKIRGLTNMRGKLVHGASDGVKVTDVITIRAYLVNSILALTRVGINEQANLDNYFERLVLSE